MVYSQPLLLLDIDGVLLPFNLLEEYNQQLVDNELVSIHPQLKQWFSFWENHFQVIWATARLEQANHIFSGLLDNQKLNLPWIDFSRKEQKHYLTNNNFQTNKLALVEQYLINNKLKDHPLVWCEDELFSDAMEWGEKRTAKTLLIRTNANKGLTNNQFQETVKFISELRQ
jgi:hypothetical protein